jgi:hypothetical protein
MEADGFDAFREAVWRKLIREIAAPAPTFALAWHDPVGERSPPTKGTINVDRTTSIAPLVRSRRPGARLGAPWRFSFQSPDRAANVIRRRQSIARRTATARPVVRPHRANRWHTAHSIGNKRRPA